MPKDISLYYKDLMDPQSCYAFVISTPAIFNQYFPYLGFGATFPLHVP